MPAKTEPGTLLKEAVEHIDCECGCGKRGTPRMKGGKPRKWRDGKVHTKNCDKSQCRACRGSGVKKKANRRELRFANSIGGRRTPLSGARGQGSDVTVQLSVCYMYFEETEEAALVRVPSKWEPLAELEATTLSGVPRVWCDDVIALVPAVDARTIIEAAKLDDGLPTHSYVERLDADLTKIRKWWSGGNIQAKFKDVAWRGDRSGGPASLALSWTIGRASDVRVLVMRRSDLDQLLDLAKMEMK